ncbi:hypothetical protein CASFOL_009454 [Castilleja foliolosa]|uniref:Transcription repressor n=1 Tax=Castilleja foliolosa TaxID=1961234 RepID=A0ABD3DXD4_9LAMI
MKFSFLFKSPETTTTTTTTTTSAVASWPWPSCATNSKTLSFRADAINSHIIHKTINPADNINTTENGISHHHHIKYDHDEINPEISIKGLRSERFFFEPGKSNSILEEAKTQPPIKQSVTKLEIIESRDPIWDFRVSMEEMVEAHGLKNWESLEKLLACYFRVNEKNNHRYIIRAFVDLLFSNQACCSGGGGGAAAIDENCSSSSFTSPLSFSSSSNYSSPRFHLSSFLGNKDEIIAVGENNESSDSTSFLGNDSSSSGV